jgi:hypothetical protein
MPVAEHEGTHTQRPPEHVWPVGQVPLQSPPQPLGVPHAAPAGQVALHGTQAPPTQRVPAAQGVAQVHESTQRPSTQRSPAVHVTPAQGLATQRPATQTVPRAQAIPAAAQGSGTHSLRMHAWPAGQVSPVQNIP